MKKIIVLGKYEPVPKGYVGVDTTSASGAWSGLSPFYLGPYWYDGIKVLRFENLWQFCKVYPEHARSSGAPSGDYWAWAKKGWEDSKAHRYPMGKGRKPLYSLWYEMRLGYIEARKMIYGPIYRRLVKKTQAYKKLVNLATSSNVALRDYDGYNHDRLRLSLSEVLNNPVRKMGHAFVLKMMLTKDPALKQFTKVNHA